MKQEPDRRIPINRPDANTSPVIAGVFAAMTLPRTPEGALNLPSFSGHLQSVVRAGVKGIVLNGATGEYCLTSPEELSEMLKGARELMGPHFTLCAAIGGASVSQTLKRLEVAQQAGADALLLPMPYFFPYDQQDLIAFSKRVAEHASVPVLLYNLPDFTSPINPDTTLQLVQQAPRIVGIKDSSGSLDTVRLLTESAPHANRVIGNDSALYGALVEHLCDGVVSGVASVLPELMLRFYYATSHAPLSETTLRLKSKLEEFIGWLGRFPVPWGLKLVAEERGFSTASLPLPMSPQRTADSIQFLQWFRANRKALLAEEVPVEVKEQMP